MDLKDIIGLKVSSIRGYKNSDGRIKKVEAEFIMFDDGETFIQLEEQDYYSFHDCSTLARNITVWKDKERYERYMKFPEANDFDF